MKKELWVAVLLMSLATACKNEWLDVKPSNALVVPTKVTDVLALLDNAATMNQAQIGDLGEIGSDNYQTTYTAYQTLAARYRNAYIWSTTDDFYEGTDANWSSAYQKILITNIALESLTKIGRPEQGGEAWDQARGTALFFRAYTFYVLAGQYAKPFSGNAETDLGIPLRLRSNITDVSRRGTLKETYDQILADLNEAITLLPMTVVTKTRPSRAAGYALLSRICLAMGNYPSAQESASQCLNMANTLIDYNDLNQTQQYPFALFNTEVIFHVTLGNIPAFNESNFDVTPGLLSLYEPDDLRLKLYFAKNGARTLFRGSYAGSNLFFSGLSVNEVILNRAESMARGGQLSEALGDLNALRRKRWNKSAAYTPYTSSNRETVLGYILMERRKELCFRGLRWADLRRLNQQEPTQVSLSKVLNGLTYSLPPNDLRYVFPIYNRELVVSGIEQNPRK